VVNSRSSNLNAAAQAGLPLRNWFGVLAADQQNAALQMILTHPAMVQLADAPRDEWRNLLWAIAHAGQLGATEAREFALA
jgi:hypothetical protein